MRFFYLSILLIFLSSCSEQIEDSSVVKISDQERWLNEICSPKYKGRKAGTIECDSVAVYLSNELADMGYTVYYQDFKYKDSLDLRNIFVRLPGISDSLIVIGAHYDGAVYGEVYPAADDNGSGVVAVLSICKALSIDTHRKNNSVLLAFWAAEEETLKNTFNGSRFFINHFDDKKKIKVYCNFDCFARKEQGTYFYYAPGAENIGQIMKSLLNTRTDTELEVVVKENTKFNSDYVPFYQSGYSYFGWNDYDPSGHIHSMKDRPESISLHQINKVVDLTLALIKEL